MTDNPNKRDHFATSKMFMKLRWNRDLGYLKIKINQLTTRGLL